MQRIGRCLATARRHRRRRPPCCAFSPARHDQLPRTLQNLSIGRFSNCQISAQSAASRPETQGLFIRLPPPPLPTGRRAPRGSRWARRPPAPCWWASASIAAVPVDRNRLLATSATTRGCSPSSTWSITRRAGAESFLWGVPLAHAPAARIRQPAADQAGPPSSG